MRRLIVALLLAACTNQTHGTQPGAQSSAGAPTAPTAPATASTKPTEQPLAAESNPPGDIPDSQAFVTYVSGAGGYRIDAPEGWARTEGGLNVKFVDKFDGLSVTVANAAAGAHAPNQVPVAVAAVEAKAHAGRGFHEKAEHLPGGTAEVIAFTSNSAPDPVTNKRVRLSDEAVIFSSGSRTATVHVWAPLGSDNADQWKRIVSSFRWR